jgi:hypothetical protein
VNARAFALHKEHVTNQSLPEGALVEEEAEEEEEEEAAAPPPPPPSGGKQDIVEDLVLPPPVTTSPSMAEVRRTLTRAVHPPISRS